MELVIPLIEESLHPPAKDFFEEDGIVLYVIRSHRPAGADDHSWQAGLHNASSLYQPSVESGLIRLLPSLLAVLGENMDVLGLMLPLLNSYLLLDAPGITQVSKA